ncbi:MULTISPECIES: hypothetical protein [Streptomyces]|uniref:Uncharacterized protein n=1 Tax=Streptomyces lichenis TaxID=2306967 RepID=A0ABT0IAK4_9ACTN|nr:hypothetical protein [Streptomyces lichenis]MCK8678325.1 hypothetical protein [Streptomyces lichenis]
MNAADRDLRQLDPVSVLNAKTTLVQLLGRAGVYSGDAEELIALVEAGALAEARREAAPVPEGAPPGKGELYAAGWGDGARAVVHGLDEIAERVLREAVGDHGPQEPEEPEERYRVGRMDLERVKVVVTRLHLSFADDSELDPEVSEQVLVAVLRTMGARNRAGYPGRLTRFTDEHRARLERMFARYGPGSPIAIHGRYTLLHSPTCVAVLERLTVTPEELRKEWDAGELPPAWLDGLTAAWEATG